MFVCVCYTKGMSEYKLTDGEFFDIYGKVPRLNVDLVIRSDEGILFGLRSIEPHAGFWHLPGGGTVYKGEKISQAAIRVAKNETGLDVAYIGDRGFMEFPSEMRNGASIHTVSIVFEVRPRSGNVRPDENAKELKYFRDVPNPIIQEHAAFVLRLLNQ